MMGLYLAIFDDDEELDGVDVGSYADFSAFRTAVVESLEPDGPGSLFPTLMLHSDCDGQWSADEAAELERELRMIGTEFRLLTPIPFNSRWKEEVAQEFSISPKSLYECFFDVDGEPLLERMMNLARLSQELNLPILFQ